MKKVRLPNMLTGLALLCSAALFNGCSKDTAATPAPTASFTYVATGRDVTFTSTSTNAKTYAWTFGDGTTSTDQNPKKTYSVYGKYTVKLTVVGAGGTKTSLPDDLTLAKSSAVKIDGSFAEWANISPISTFATDGNKNLPSLLELKMDYDAAKIYYYVKGTSASLAGLQDVYFNVDGDTLTGYASGTWRSFGADYLVEEALGNNVSPGLFEFSGATQNDFAWGGPGVASGTGFFANSGAVTLSDGTKALEFSISRLVFNKLSTSIGTSVVDRTSSYDDLGSLPGEFISKRLVYLDLTK
jgi:PKD repeat protein